MRLPTRNKKEKKMKIKQEKVIVNKKIYVSAIVETLILDEKDIITSSSDDYTQDDIFER